jgi:hypothetical protein
LVDATLLHYLKKNKMELSIVSYSKIRNNTVWTNGLETYNCDPSVDLTKFLSNVYKELNLSYPKFFKMDNLCKLGVLATELAIKNNVGFEKHAKEKVAIFLSNKASSIETDRNYEKTIEDKNNYFPSPSLFVYTLPNIVIGEIAIKHKLTGENVFFVSERFDANLMMSYISIALKNDSTSSVICGWVNVDGDDYEAFVFCVEKTNFNLERTGIDLPLTIDTINKIIK